MKAFRPGRPAAFKYDLITALCAHGAASDKATQARMQRLTLLITARFCWADETVSVGRAELARLWSVDERTARRDLSWLRAQGWLTLQRPPGRGRVSTYRLDLDAMLRDTRPVWTRVGPDFEDRMTRAAGLGAAASASPRPAAASTAPEAPSPAAAEGAGLWARASARLRAADPDRHRAWFARLAVRRETETEVDLAAPSGFVARYVETHFLEDLRLSLQAVAGGPVRLRVAC